MPNTYIVIAYLLIIWLLISLYCGCLLITCFRNRWCRIVLEQKLHLKIKVVVITKSGLWCREMSCLCRNHWRNATSTQWCYINRTQFIWTSVIRTSANLVDLTLLCSPRNPILQLLLAYTHVLWIVGKVLLPLRRSFQLFPVINQNQYFNVFCNFISVLKDNLFGQSTVEQFIYIYVL